ncbi:MAG: metallophosphoesterase [Polyangiaceae bacterium]
MTTDTPHPRELKEVSTSGRRSPSRRARFFRVVLGVNVVMHLPVALGVGAAARDLGVPWPALVGWAWAAAGVGLFLGRVRMLMPDRKRSALSVRLVDLPYFIHWCAALWTLVPSVVATLLAPVVALARGVPFALPTGVYEWAYLSGLVICGYGILVRRKWFRVVERVAQVEGLDPRLEGLRIAQLSDLHIGGHTPRSWGLRWAEAANGRAPDIAVVTGDMVTSGQEFHEDVAAVVGALRARLGVFVSMGNHDYFGDGEPLMGLLRGQGVQVLRNEGVLLEHGGAPLWLAAIDDTWTRRHDVTRAMRDRPQGSTAVLLAHDPDAFDEAAEAGADFVLSGHTHGGQIGIPFFARAANLASFTHRYILGFYRKGRALLYVHPGLGTTGPPMRLGVAPEVTILVLKRAT